MLNHHLLNLFILPISVVANRLRLILIFHLEDAVQSLYFFPPKIAIKNIYPFAHMLQNVLALRFFRHFQVHDR